MLCKKYLYCGTDIAIFNNSSAKITSGKRRSVMFKRIYHNIRDDIKGNFFYIKENRGTISAHIYLTSILFRLFKAVLSRRVKVFNNVEYYDVWGA